MNTTYAARRSHNTAPVRATRRGLTRSRDPRLSGAEIVTLVVIVALLAVGVVARPAPSTSAGTQAVQVQAGDTLWSIARAHPIAGLSTAQTAEAIARDNRLTVGALTAGQALLVPASAERGQALAKR